MSKNQNKLEAPVGTSKFDPAQICFVFMANANRVFVSLLVVLA